MSSREVLIERDGRSARDGARLRPRLWWGGHGADLDPPDGYLDGGRVGRSSGRWRDPLHGARRAERRDEEGERGGRDRYARRGVARLLGRCTSPDRLGATRPGNGRTIGHGLADLRLDGPARIARRSPADGHSLVASVLHPLRIGAPRGRAALRRPLVGGSRVVAPWRQGTRRPFARTSRIHWSGGRGHRGPRVSAERRSRLHR